MKQAPGILFAVLVLLATSLAGAAQVAAQTEGPRLTVTAGALNVRRGPGINYVVIGGLYSGDQVTGVARDVSGAWYQVKLRSAGNGWINAAYVRVTSGDISGLPVAPAPPLEGSGPHANVSSSAESGPVVPIRSAAGTASGTLVFRTVSGGAIYAIRPDGSGLRFLTNGMDPALSPDGQTLAFTRWTNGGEDGVWLIGVDGSGERLLLAGMTQPRSPAWSPGGDRVAISMFAGGRRLALRVCVPLGKGRPAIPADAYDVSAEPGPPASESTGSVMGKLCFHQAVDPAWSLRLITVSDGTFQDLAQDRYALAPTWDPAHAWLLVYQGDHGLMSVNVDRHAASLVSADVDQRAPEFSPDGSKIATSFRESDHWEVHVMNADGTGDTRLTTTPPAAILEAQQKGQPAPLWNNAAPAWSPDGRHIAFLSDRDGQWEIWVMNADGSEQRLLVSAASLGASAIQFDGVDERVITWR
jgi:TolB protein